MFFHIETMDVSSSWYFHYIIFHLQKVFYNDNASYDCHFTICFNKQHNLDSDRKKMAFLILSVTIH